MMRKANIAALLAVCWMVAALAAPVGSNDVARAIGNWRHRRGTLGAKMGENVWNVRKVEWNGVSFHIVRFEGGGHVISPVDTRIRPVVMFSEGDDLDLDPRNPALALIAADIGGETERKCVDKGVAPAVLAAVSRSREEDEWAELLADAPDYAYKNSINDVRVEPLTKTTWSQEEVKEGNTNDYCYNYYTPNHYCCGCVATAIAQIMKYFEWPKESVPRWESSWTSVDGVAKNLKTQGGVFDWVNMPDSPGKSTSELERQAIGKLTSDVGIIVGMSYESDGSGTYAKLGRFALKKTVLGYSNALMAVWPNSADFRHGTEADFKRVMTSNFNAKRPVLLGIEGHAIVGDGYGYDGKTLYYHLNFGWSGSWNYWYSTPVNNDNPIGKSYVCFSSIVYNIYRTESEDFVILSGRVTDKVTGNAKQNQLVIAYDADGRTVKEATTDEHGIYSMLVPPATYTVAACNESEDHRSEYSGFAEGTALRCVTAENNGRSGNSFPYGPIELGNCADCDIAMETVEYDPEAEVSVGDVSVGTDFAEAVVPVMAKVVHYGQTATGAKVVVTLTPVGGGTAKRWDSGEIGDFVEHGLNASFEGLEAGVAYRVEAKVVMIGTSEQAGLGDGSFAAAREFTWFDESAAAFSAAKWTGAGTTVKVVDGNLSVDGAKDGTTTFTPESKDICATRVVIKVRECGCYPSDRIPNPDGPAAIATVAGIGDMMELVVWGDGKWNKTGIKFTEEAVNCDVTVDLDFHRHVVRYGVADRSLGTYSIPNTVSTVSSVAFKGYTVLSELAGTAWDANLVNGADGKEYVNFAAARSAGATEPLSPLWLSTWNLTGGSGSLDVRDPQGHVTYTGDSRIVKSETLPDGSERKWFAQASDADIAAGADKYIKTTVDLGLAKAISDLSVVKIDGFAVADGKMSFKVKVGQEEVTKAAIMSKVEISEALDMGWRNPDTDEIVFDATKHEITVTPKPTDDPSQKPTKNFVRVRMPIDGK